MKLSAIVLSALAFGGAVSFLGTAAGAQNASVAQLEATAHSAQAAIQTSPQDYKAMQSAIAMQSASAARTVLEKHGFTAQQLQGGVIVFSHAILPKKVQPHQYYYMEIDHSPFKISVHALPTH